MFERKRVLSPLHRDALRALGARAPGASGWTVVELTLALSALGVLLAIGVGSLGSARDAVRGAEARHALLGSLVQARNAAVLRDADVVLCPSGNGADCADTHHWEQGWVVFVDYDDDRRRGTSEPVIGGHGPLAGNVGLVTSRGRRTLDFQPNGGNAGSNATFTLCDGRGPTRATAYAMSNAGGLRAIKPSASAVVDACRL